MEKIKNKIEISNAVAPTTLQKFEHLFFSILNAVAPTTLQKFEHLFFLNSIAKW